MTRRLTVQCDSIEATQRLAAHLAGFVAPGQLVVLAGGLGAGKTTFAKGYARALGVTALVTSPSYTLANHYRCGPGQPIDTLIHADLWRLEGANEVQDLGLDELLDERAAALVEWGDRFAAALHAAPLVVTFDVVAATTTRALTIDLAASLVPDTALLGITT